MGVLRRRGDRDPSGDIECTVHGVADLADLVTIRWTLILLLLLLFRWLTTTLTTFPTPIDSAPKYTMPRVGPAPFPSPGTTRRLCGPRGRSPCSRPITISSRLSQCIPFILGTVPSGSLNRSPSNTKSRSHPSTSNLKTPIEFCRRNCSTTRTATARSKTEVTGCRAARTAGTTDPNSTLRAVIQCDSNNPTPLTPNTPSRSTASTTNSSNWRSSSIARGNNPPPAPTTATTSPPTRRRPQCESTTRQADVRISSSADPHIVVIIFVNKMENPL